MNEVNRQMESKDPYQNMKRPVPFPGVFVPSELTTLAL